MTGTPDVSVVIPCLNEAESIEACVQAVREVLDDAGYHGEVVVVDNGSTDGSGELAAAAGARVVHEPRRGYGRAYLTGPRGGPGPLHRDARRRHDLRRRRAPRGS